MTTPRSRRLDALNVALTAAEDRLYDLNPGATGCVYLSADTFLFWDKIEGKWGLSVGPEGAPKRLLECSVAERMQAALVLDELLVDIKDSMEEESQLIDAATASANAFLADQQERLGER